MVDVLIRIVMVALILSAGVVGCVLWVLLCRLQRRIEAWQDTTSWAQPEWARQFRPIRNVLLPVVGCAVLLGFAGAMIIIVMGG